MCPKTIETKFNMVRAPLKVQVESRSGHCRLSESKMALSVVRELLERIPHQHVNKKVLENLIKCGAFDWTGNPRKSLWEALTRCIDGRPIFRLNKTVRPNVVVWSL